ncbi:MAG: hypothetical protein Fur0022_30580 [Anaerolineales bacterium]
MNRYKCFTYCINLLVLLAIPLAILSPALTPLARAFDSQPQTRTNLRKSLETPLGGTNWCVAGSFQGWNNTSHPLNDSGQNGDLLAEDGIFSRNFTIASPGRYEWKVVECGNWGNAYPSNNSWFYTTSPNQSVRFTFDTNDHSADAGAGATPTTHIVSIAGDDVPANFTAVGDWQGWNNSNPATAMTNIGNGQFYLKYTIATAGTYMAKVTQTGSWNEQFTNDGRAIDGPVINFTTTNPNEEVVFLLDTRASRLTITSNSSTTGNWCLVGDFQGWNNTGNPMYDDGTNGDLIGGDGMFSLDYTIATAGRKEWKIVECGNWSNAYPAQNAWVNTTTANQTVKFTFDTNDHSSDAGWPLVPTTHIVNAFDDLPASFNAVGSFQGWNNGDPAYTLTDMGNGIHVFTTTMMAGSYIGKITTTGSWDAFGNDGRSKDAANVNITVANDGDLVTFLLDTGSGRLAIVPPPIVPPPPVEGCTGGAGQDNNIWWDDLGHNSRDGLYRTPGGPVVIGTEITLRLRAACGDLTNAQLRVYNDRLNQQTLFNMELVQQEGPYEWWEVTVPASPDPTVYWYRFIAQDGTATAYYEDDPARNGGWGQTYAVSPDNSWQLTHYDPAFQTPDWVKNAVIYQIFTDRFKDGDPSNNTPAGSFFYNETTTIIRSNGTDWNTPICDPRDSGSPCPGVYSQNFYGGDLQGIIDKLDYLESLGVTALYLNPIFESPSNHKYDTTDFSIIDDNFGDLVLFQQLVAEASLRGMSVILDGVFNHTSSDSIYFDRYGRYPEVGACEDINSPYRDWYYFTDVTPGTGSCVGSDGTPNAATYTSWFGFDSLPKLNASIPEVRELIWAGGSTSIARFWVEEGAQGWRLDVGGDVDPGTLNDPTNTYWEGFRDAVHQSNPEAYIVGEEWGNATSWVIDNQWDATMNYQYSSLMLSFWRDAPFVDNDHNAGSSAGILTPLTPSQLNEGLLNWIERYPPEALAAMMNLLGSHDTNRPLFMLDHNAALGTDDTLLDNPNYNWSESIQRLKGVLLLQMTLPGAPTIYYGDEVGTVGQVSYDGSTWQDDPYNRQPFPWLDETGTPFYAHLQSQANQDALFNYYATLIAARDQHPALRTGSFDPLLVDDANDLYAYGRKMADHSDAALVILNRAGTIASPITQTVTLDLSGYLPYGTNFTEALTGDGYVIEANGLLTVTVPGQSGAVLVLNGIITPPPAAVDDLVVDAEFSEALELDWNPALSATSYDIYRSTLSGGAYEYITTITDTNYIDTGLENAVTYYYVVVSRDDTTGLESGFSNEAAGTPHHDLSTAWYNLQWPPTITHTISTITPTVNIYGQLWISGATGGSGPATGIIAQVGYALSGTQPITSTAWIWVNMAYDSPQGNNDQFVGNLLPDFLGTYHYATRYSSDGGQTWYYADLGGPGYNPEQAGILWVVPSSDTTPPATPQNLTLDETTPSSISFSWDPNGDADLAGYEVYRQEISATLQTPADGFTRIAQLDASHTAYTDLTVVADHTYEYYILAYDTSFNRSEASNIITGTAEARLATVVMNVTVPDPSPGTVFIAGNIPGYPEWDPGAIALTPGISNTWTITFTLLDGAEFEYKFTRGSWNTVEKEADGNTEIPNRQLTVDYGKNGLQMVNHTVANWRDPFVVSTYPADDALGVNPSTVISVTWNQAMPSSTDFTVQGPHGTVSGTFSYDPGSFTTLFTPDQPLEIGAEYAVYVANELDVAGDAQQVSTLFNFAILGANLETTITDSSDPVLLGNVLTYTVIVNNYGLDTAPNVILTNTLPSGVTYLSNTAGCSEASGVLTCAFGDIINGDFRFVHILVTASQTGTFTNTAIATSDLVDPDPANNVAAETTTITDQTADLAVTLSALDPVTLGDTFTYTIVITNNGPHTAPNLLLVDTLPAGIEYVADDTGCSEAAGVVTCALGDLSSGATLVVHLTVSAEQIGTWINTVTVSSEAVDPNEENNTTTEETTILEPVEYKLYLPILLKNE